MDIQPPEVPKLIPYSTNSVYADQIIVSTCLLHNICLFGKVFYDNMKSKELSIQYRHSNLLYYITISTVASFFIFNLSQLLTIYEFGMSLGCIKVIILNIILYYIGKYLSWIFSLVRLIVVFYNKSWGYSAKCLIIIAILLTIDVIIVSVSTMFFVDSEMQTVADGTSKYCSVDSKNIIAYWFTPILESSATIGCFWLFYRKMKLLQSTYSPKSPKSISSSPQPTKIIIHGLNEEKQKQINIDYDLLYIIRKYAILSAATIVTSWTVVFLVIFSSLSFSAVAIDSVMNCWFIILFDKRYDNIYTKLFGYIAYSKLHKNMNKARIIVGTKPKNNESTMRTDEKNISQIVQMS